MKREEKVKAAVEWFMNATIEQQNEAVEALFDHAILSEWIGVVDPEDREELAEESGKPIEYYSIPYFRTCGEPIAEAAKGGRDE